MMHIIYSRIYILQLTYKNKYDFGKWKIKKFILLNHTYSRIDKINKSEVCSLSPPFNINCKHNDWRYFCSVL